MNQNISPKPVKTPINTSVRKRYAFIYSDFTAWSAIAIIFAFTALGCVAGLGGLLRFIFPVASLLLAVYLYAFKPITFITYNWLIWCFSPLLRRLGDYYRGGFDDFGIMLLAPYLVTFVCALTLFKQLPKAHKTGDLSFVAIASSVLYAFFIGALNNPPVLVVRTFLEWMSPVLFGFHIASSWRFYPEIRKATQATFLCIILLTGIYGIYQFIFAPVWDTFWLESTGIVTMGRPEPLGLRVWSTTHSPPPYGCLMMSALLLLFSSRSFWKLPAASVGYLSFLLSMVRAAWLGWMVGILTLLALLKPSLKTKMIITIVVMFFVVVPLANIDPFSEIIGDRLETFLYIQQDTSYLARGQTYERHLGIAMTNFIGQGLGSTFFILPNGQLQRIAFDSGFLDLFYTLGWLGGLPYLLGILLISLSLLQLKQSSSDPFVSAIIAITASFFTVILLGPFMLGLSGIVMFGFLGCGEAARKYYLINRKY